MTLLFHIKRRIAGQHRLVLERFSLKGEMEEIRKISGQNYESYDFGSVCCRGSTQRMLAINIGENIQVTVLRIAGNHVRIGVEAPNSVPAHRAERAIKTGQKKNKVNERGGTMVSP